MDIFVIVGSKSACGDDYLISDRIELQGLTERSLD